MHFNSHFFYKAKADKSKEIQTNAKTLRKNETLEAEPKHRENTRNWNRSQNIEKIQRYALSQKRNGQEETKIKPKLITMSPLLNSLPEMARLSSFRTFRGRLPSSRLPKAF